MSRLTLRKLCVRAPRIRIVSIGESAILYEPPCPSPLPYFGEIPGSHERPRAAGQHLPRLDLRAAPVRDVRHPAGVRPVDAGAPRLEPAARRHRHGGLRAYPGPA